MRCPDGVHTYENTANLNPTGTNRISNRGNSIGGSYSMNHRRTSSNVSNSSGNAIPSSNSSSSSNINPVFRLEDELPSGPNQSVSSFGIHQRVAYDIDPRPYGAQSSNSSFRMARQNSLEMERPGTLVKLCFYTYIYSLTN